MFGDAQPLDVGKRTNPKRQERVLCGDDHPSERDDRQPIDHQHEHRGSDRRPRNKPGVDLALDKASIDGLLYEYRQDKTRQRTQQGERHGDPDAFAQLWTFSKSAAQDLQGRRLFFSEQFGGGHRASLSAS